MDLMKINKNQSFGNQVKYYRVKNKINQTELASMLNVTREVILNLENKDKLVYNTKQVKDILNIVDTENEITIKDDYLNFILNNPSEKIRLYRERHNLNKVEFAKLMNVNIKTVRCWENGNNIISKVNYKSFEHL